MVYHVNTTLERTGILMQRMMNKLTSSTELAGADVIQLLSYVKGGNHIAKIEGHYGSLEH